MNNIAIRTNSTSVELRDTGHRSVTPNRRNKQKGMRHKPFFMGIGIILLIATITFTGLYLYRLSTNSATIANNTYQAVFFTNGQVYFGKLQSLSGGYLKLTDIFYLQTKASTPSHSSNPQATSDQSTPDVQLMKLGNEIHGPEDEMIIDKDQVLFYENIKNNSKVSTSIARYQDKR